MSGRWLFKTEPSDYSFDRLLKEKKVRWSGVANPLALKHLRAVAKGDAVMIYHTGGERAIVGLAKAASAPYPDPDAGDPKLVVVDLAADRALATPVALDALKKDARFRDFPLVRMGRLSVMPVPGPLWTALLTMATRGA